MINIKYLLMGCSNKIINRNREEALEGFDGVYNYFQFTQKKQYLSI